MSSYSSYKKFNVTWIRWYVSDIIAISRLIKTITDTSKYVPKIILKKPSVQSGRNWGIGLISSDVVCPNTAKNNLSNAMIGVIGPISIYFRLSDPKSFAHFIYKNMKDATKPTSSTNDIERDDALEKRVSSGSWKKRQRWTTVI